MSQITTHILDTSLGRPAAGVAISLEKPMGNTWEKIATGLTNSDGRIPNLLSPGDILPPGRYAMRFGTEAYFSTLGIASFYPDIRIEFLVSDASHYHIPLLLNPFGYSTYRGS